MNLIRLFSSYRRSGCGSFLNEYDTALRLSVFFRDGAAEAFGDVGDENLVIKHYAFLSEDVVSKHGVTVAHVVELVVMAGKGVSLLEVERLAIDHNILNTVLTVNTNEHLGIVEHNAGGEIGVYFVGEAFSRAEPAAELAGPSADAQFKSIENFLAGNFADAESVAEGVNFQNVVESDIACGDGDANAAAVDECNVSTGNVLVSICTEVTDIGFLVADETYTGFSIGDAEVESGVCNNFSELCIELCSCIYIGICHFRSEAEQFRSRNIVFPLPEAGFHGAVNSNLQVADAFQLGAAALAENFFTVFVEHDDLIGVMAVAIEECIDAVGVFNDVGVSPGLTGSFIAAVGKNYNIVNAFSAGCINSRLDSGVKLVAVIALAEAVNKLTVFIHEVFRGGRGDGLRGADADKCDLCIVKFLNDVRSKHGLAVVQEVAAYIGELSKLSKLKEAIHAIVKFMVADGCDFVTEGVHELNVGRAGGHGCKRFTLNGVTVVNKDHVVALSNEIVTDKVEADVGPAGVNAAVNVRSEENIQVVLKKRSFLSCFAISECKASEQHRKDEENCYKLFHVLPSI